MECQLEHFMGGKPWMSQSKGCPPEIEETEWRWRGGWMVPAGWSRRKYRLN